MVHLVIDRHEFGSVLADLGAGQSFRRLSWLLMIAFFAVIGALLPSISANSMDGAGGGESNPFASASGDAGAIAFSGGASVSIPIAVPTGRLLTTPSLALTYSSQSGLSPAGLGWSFGIGMVARESKRGVPRCGASNMNDFHVSLNSSSNVLVQAGPDLYLQKIDEAYSESIADRNANTWITTNRSGLKYSFGETPESRVFFGADEFYEESPCEFTTEWHATSVTDPNGNSLRITYQKSGNTPLPAQIEYGGNESAGIPHPYRVEVVTEQIPSGKPLLRTFTAGVEQVLDQRIKHIIVLGRETGNGPFIEIRRYTLNYDEDMSHLGQEFRLTSLDLTGHPTRTFEYSTTTPSAEPAYSNAVNDSTKLGRTHTNGTDIALMDLNGDGVMDRLCNHSGVDWNAAYGNPRASVNTNSTPNDDQVFPEGVDCDAVAGSNWSVPSNSSLEVDHSGQISRVGLTNDAYHDIYTTMDITGDGIPDLFTRKHQNLIKVFRGSCSSAFSCGFSTTADSPHWNNPGNENNERLIERVVGNRGTRILSDLIDMNGDGRPDLVRKDPDLTWRVNLNNGHGFDPAIFYPAMDDVLGYSAHPHHNAPAEREFIDINADGLLDWVSAPRSEDEDSANARIPNVYFVINEITGAIDSGPFEVDDPANGFLCRTNNPGQAVLCSKGQGPLPATSAIVGALSVRLNTGSGFTAPVYSPAPFWRGGHTSASQLRASGKDSSSQGATHSWIFRDFADVNGDGRPDLVATGEMYDDGTTNWYYMPNLGDGRFGGQFVVTQTASPATYSSQDHPSVHLGVVRPAATIANVGQYLGRGFTEADPSGRYNLQMTVLDIDGDGIGERVSAYGLQGGDQWELRKIKFDNPGYENIKPNLLLRMNDGFGGSTEFLYEPGSRFAGLQPNPGSGIVGAGVPFPIWVVTGIRKSDGLCSSDPIPDEWFALETNPCLANGHDVVQKFEYAKGAFDGPDREFRGFGEVTTFDAPLGIGAARRQTFFQDDYRKGKTQLVENFAGAVTEPLVSRTTFDWQFVVAGVRTQVYLREQRVEEFPVYTGLGSQTGYGSQCVVHRNEITLPNSSIDPQTRIHAACSMACDGSGPSESGCNPQIAGAKHVEMEYATPVTNSSSGVWDRPISIRTYYRPTANTLQLSSERQFYYDDLSLGQVDRGRVSRERHRISESPDEWSEQYTVYDDGNSIGPGNMTSIHVPSSVPRDPQVREYDPVFQLFPTAEELPPTGPTSAPVIHRVERTFDYRFGTVSTEIGVLGAAAGQVSGTVRDVLGRPICEFGPGTACTGGGTGGAVEFQYQFGDPAASSFAGKLNSVAVRRKEPNAPGGYLTTTTYWDALGRERLTTNQQLNSATNSIETVVARHIIYGFHGKAWKSYEPYFLTGALSLAPPASLASTETFYALNGNAQGRLDPAGRVFKVKQVDGSEPISLYLGTTLESYSPEGHLTRSTVDTHGRVVERETFNQSGGVALSKANVVYDGGDRVIEEWFGGDVSTKIEKIYDLAGRLIENRDPDSGTWTKKYDSAGNVLYHNDPKPNQSVQTCYDQQDRVLLECGQTTDTYDPNLCAAPNPSCYRKFVYKYDETSNVAGATNLGKGRLTTVEGTWTTIKYVYDVRGRVLTRQDIYLGSVKTTSFQYRSDIDRMTKMTYPDGEIVKYGYDAAGQPTTLSQVNSSDQWLAWYIMDAKYDIRGRPTLIQRGNATVDTMTYHDASEGFRLKFAKSERPSAGPSDPGEVFLHLFYNDYDGSGRILTIADQRWTSGPLSMTGSYQYDGAGRLLSSDVVGQRAAGAPSDPETFQYNAVGNMTHKNGFALAYGYAGKPHQASSVLTSGSTSWGMHYDENGQRDAKVNNGSTVAQEYIYDPFGNLNQIKINGAVSSSFGYDHTGQRVFETGSSGSRWFYGQYSEGIGSSQLLVKYYYFGGQAVATRADSAPWLFGAGSHPGAPITLPPEIYWSIMFGAIVLFVIPIAVKRHRWAMAASPSGAVGAVLLVVAMSMPLAFSTGCPGDAPIRHLHMGHLGGPIAVSKLGGDVDRQYRYSAYGEVRRYDKYGAGIGFDGENRREYTGYETDPASGLQYAGVRYYDPTAMTFTSLDPVEQVANPYAYVGWDPINRIDPNGAYYVAPIVQLIAQVVQTAVTIAALTAPAIYRAANTGNAGVYFADVGLMIGAIAQPVGFGIYGIVQRPQKISSYFSLYNSSLGGFVGNIETLATADDPAALAFAGVGVGVSVIAAAIAIYGYLSSGSNIGELSTDGTDLVITENNDPLTPEDIDFARSELKAAMNSETFRTLAKNDPTVLAVNIEVNNSSEFRYVGNPKGGGDVIRVDPNDKIQIRTKSGRLKPYPLRRAIIHEFGHHPQGGIGWNRHQWDAIRLENQWAKEFRHPHRRN